MGDIGKPIRETERPAPVRTPVPEREPAPTPTPRDPAPVKSVRAGAQRPLEAARA